MVLGVEQGAGVAQLLLEGLGQPQVGGHPAGHAIHELVERGREVVDLAAEQPVELGQGLVIEDCRVEVADPDPALLEGVADGVGREGGVVLLSCEALFARRGDGDPVD